MQSWWVLLVAEKVVGECGSPEGVFGGGGEDGSE